MTNSTALRPLVSLPPPSVLLFAALLAALALWTAFRIVVPVEHATYALDFQLFHLVGEMTNRGEVAAAYHLDQLAAAPGGAVGFLHHLPYTYPPQANLIVAALALVPAWLGYLAFTGLGAAGFLFVLHRLAGPHFAGALVAVFPALVMTILTGQNGFFTAAIMGAFCLLWTRRFAGGGALGLMIFKPSLALGLAFAVLMRGRWRLFVVAAICNLFVLVLATAAFGIDLWRDYLEALRRTALPVGGDGFPLGRLASVYGLASTLGASTGAALALHVGVAAAAMTLVGQACLGNWETRRILSLAVFAGLMISPGTYDCDLVVASVAIALAAPDLVTLARRVERRAVFAGMWFATGWGAAAHTILPPGAPAISALGLLVAATAISTVLYRAEAAAKPVLVP